MKKGQNILNYSFNYDLNTDYFIAMFEQDTIKNNIICIEIIDIEFINLYNISFYIKKGNIIVSKNTLIPNDDGVIDNLLDEISMDSDIKDIIINHEQDTIKVMIPTELISFFPFNEIAINTYLYDYANCNFCKGKFIEKNSSIISPQDIIFDNYYK